MRTLFAVTAAAVLAALVCAPVACLATVDLYAWIQSQSPDGRTIEVNGYVGSSDANIIGWTYNWGDGSASTGYFPMIHRYGWPDLFTVTVTGYDDTGDTTMVAFDVTVPAPYPTDVYFVLCEPGCWSIKDTDSLEVRLFAFDSGWERISMEGRSVEIYAPGASDFVEIDVRDSVLMVTAKHLEGRDFAWSSIYPYVDGVRSLSAVDLMTNTNPGDFYHYHLTYVGSYLPDTFFVACSLSVDEYTHINDYAFNAGMGSTYGKNPNQGDRSEFQGISYSPPLFGASGNPIGIGDFTIPQNGRPYFDVIFHEMGHNFSGVNMFFNCASGGGPFYGETVAEWYVQYDIDHILANHSGDLSGLAIGMLEEIRDDNRAYHLWEYDNYIRGGCQFDYYDISSSHALVEMIYEYCDIYGWDRIAAFLDFFEPGRYYDYSQILGNDGGISDETDRVTILLAAITVAFRHDVREDFERLDFPVNDQLFDALMGLWGAGTPGGRPGAEDPAVQGKVIVLYQSRPNPAAGAAEVSYWLAREMEVDLALYDIQGRVVAALDRGSRPAGLSTVSLDGSGLSPGIYFCRLAAGGLVEQHKVVLAR